MFGLVALHPVQSHEEVEDISVGNTRSSYRGSLQIVEDSTASSRGDSIRRQEALRVGLNPNRGLTCGTETNDYKPDVKKIIGRKVEEKA